VPDSLTETGRYKGMEMNLDKTKVNRILWKPSTVQIMIDKITADTPTTKLTAVTDEPPMTQTIFWLKYKQRKEFQVSCIGTFVFLYTIKFNFLCSRKPH
jgi:hypothetical protein